MRMQRRYSIMSIRIRGSCMSNVTSDLFTQMGEHTGEISVVIAIVVVFILGVTVLNTLKGE
jgi:hypothetical protein